MAHADLDGSFATADARRRERRWQHAGLVALVLLLAAALFGVVGQRGTVGRAAIVYACLLLVFRIAGRRTLAQVTTFDLILVLIIGDATQQALIGDDFTVTTALVAVATLVVLDVTLGRAKQRWPAIDVIVDGLPLPLMTARKQDHEQMASEGVTTDDLLIAARQTHGLTRLGDIDHAILEPSGAISIVPRRP
jgi:uncharacterized membrane protein YcaP (DUF421 family)